MNGVIAKSWALIACLILASPAHAWDPSGGQSYPPGDFPEANPAAAALRPASQADYRWGPASPEVYRWGYDGSPRAYGSPAYGMPYTQAPQNLRANDLRANAAQLAPATYSRMVSDLPAAELPPIDLAPGEAGTFELPDPPVAADRPSDLTEVDPFPFPAPGNSHGGGDWREQEAREAALRQNQEDVLYLTEPAPVFSSGSWFWNSNWYTRQDVAVMRVSEQNLQVFAIDLSTGDGLSSRTETYGYEPGVQFRLGRILGRDAQNRDQMIEFRFLGAFQYDASATLGAAVDNSIVTNLAPTLPGFDFADRVTLDRSAEYDQFDLNFVVRSRSGRDRLVCRPNGVWVRHASPSRIMKFSGGVRFISLDDTMTLTSASTDPASDSGVLFLDTNNDLLGFAFGLGYAEQYSDWSFGVDFSAGGLVNFIDRTGRVDSIAAGIANSVSQELDDISLSFTADLSIYAVYYLRPNVALRASYDLHYLNNLAWAVENARPTDVGLRGLSKDGFMFADGARFGIDLYW